MCVCEGHSSNKGNFAKKALFALAAVFKKSIVMVFFMPQKIVSMTFFTDHYTQNFFFTGESAYFHSMDCLFNSGP